MSRSYKAPFWKDANEKTHQRIAEKKVRAAKVIANGGEFKKLYCSWNISDFSFYSPNDPKARRK